MMEVEISSNYMLFMAFASKNVNLFIDFELINATLHTQF